MATLSREARRLDDMSAPLPLTGLQREQRHVLRHAVRLLTYLNAYATGNESGFVLLLHDVATECDREVEAILASLHAGRTGRGCPMPELMGTCP